VLKLLDKLPRVCLLGRDSEVFFGVRILLQPVWRSRLAKIRRLTGHRNGRGAKDRTSDILLDVLAEELRVLRDEAGVHVEAAQVDVGEPHAVQRDVAARRRVEVH